MKLETKSHTLSPLGKATTYISEYQRELLFPISRTLNRDEIQVFDKLPFKGVDIWNAYELSWLNLQGKPVVALAQFVFPCESPNIIESKSFKLYLNSFTNSKFASVEIVRDILAQDLSDFSGNICKVDVIPLELARETKIKSFSGICLDSLNVECDRYHVEPTLLRVDEKTHIEEVVYSDLLKSNCLVTGQPDWGSVQIQYSGQKIQHESLLKYIVSFRNHNEFHEQCVERIFMDIMRQCQPNKLTVHACYTRRGGLDINPFRSTEWEAPGETARQFRQ
ncbi:MAG: NADPH-dependent 7-cyano-7-deazaguanine reductase QueF [Gammaproteobacteria bacterium]